VYPIVWVVALGPTLQMQKLRGRVAEEAKSEDSCIQATRAVGVVVVVTDGEEEMDAR
jgi:hypothetical protein